MFHFAAPSSGSCHSSLRYAASSKRSSASSATIKEFTVFGDDLYVKGQTYDWFYMYQLYANGKVIASDMLLELDFELIMWIYGFEKILNIAEFAVWDEYIGMCQFLNSFQKFPHLIIIKGDLLVDWLAKSVMWSGIQFFNELINQLLCIRCKSKQAEFCKFDTDVGCDETL